MVMHVNLFFNPSGKLHVTLFGDVRCQGLCGVREDDTIYEGRGDLKLVRACMRRLI